MGLPPPLPWAGWNTRAKPLDTHDGTEPRFPGDQQAWIYVVVRARAGSERHQQALTLLDPCERCLIEATCGPV